MMPVGAVLRQGITGQERALARLEQLMDSGRLHHAFLFHGPEGVGKFQAALRLASVLLAEPDVSRIFHGRHADTLLLRRLPDEKSGKIPESHPVEQIRQIGEFLSLTAANAAYRIVILDDADCLNRHGQNAILKILEEPPKQAMLILVCSRPGRLLATVRSRCQRVAFDALPDNLVQQLLQPLNPGIAADELQRICAYAEGSPGLAQRLIAAGGLDFLRRVFGLFARPAPSLSEIVRFSESLGEGGDGYHLLQEMVQLRISRWLTGLAAGTPVAYALPEEAETLGRYVRFLPFSQGLALYDDTLHILGRAASANLDRKLAVTEILDRLHGEGALTAQETR